MGKLLQEVKETSQVKVAEAKAPAKLDAAGRIAQLEQQIKTRESEDKSTGSQERKLRLVKLVVEMSEHLDPTYRLSDESAKTLEGLLKEYTPGVSITVKEGDDLIQLLEANKSVKNLYAKILKSCEKQGLIIKGTKIVKA